MLYFTASSRANQTQPTDVATIIDRRFSSSEAAARYGSPRPNTATYREKLRQADPSDRDYYVHYLDCTWLPSFWNP